MMMQHEARNEAWNASSARQHTGWCAVTRTRGGGVPGGDGSAATMDLATEFSMQKGVL